ncbi:MAG: alpha/beta hydrolase, partial [Paracoccaceae bacterium]
MPAAPLYDLKDVPSGGNALFVTATDGTQIRVAFWKGGGRGTVLLFPGRTEYIEKYGRVISRLLERNLNVVVIDWRGQGLSDRPDNRLDRGYVANFIDYQQDIAAALAAPEIAALKGPRLLLSHSMGGCIGLRAMVDGLDIKAAIFSSPMWGFTEPLATVLLVKTLDFIGLGKSLVPGMKPGFY